MKVCVYMCVCMCMCICVVCSMGKGFEGVELRMNFTEWALH